MRRSTKRLIYSIELSVLVLVVLFYACWYNIRRADDKERWIYHTNDVLRSTNQVVLYAMDNELAARNFMLTAQEPFVTEAESSYVAAIRELAHLRELIRDNKEQAPLLDSIQTYLSRRADFSNLVIIRRRAQGAQAATNLITKGIGRRSADQMRRFVALVRTNEQRLLRERRLASQRALDQMNISIGVTIAFILVLIIRLLYIARREVGARRRLLERLESAHREISLLFNRIDEVFFSRDMVTDRLIQMSATCQRLYDYSAKEFMDNPDLWIDIIHPDDRETAENEAIVLALGRPLVNKYRIIRKDGGVRWVENKIIPMLDENGTLVRIDGVSRDITLREKHIAEIVDRNKALEEFTYIVSHQLRLPVANIIGLGHALELVERGSEQQQVLIGDIIRSIENLDGMVLQLNNALRVEEAPQSPDSPL